MSAEKAIAELKSILKAYEQALPDANNLSVGQLDAKIKEIHEIKKHISALDFSETALESIRNNKKETPTFRK